MPRVDILLATYNGARFIREQLTSVLEQSYANLRVLVSDDGSTDRTTEIVAEMSIEDPRILLLPSMTAGSAAGNFMSLLRHVTSEYAMFCDQDDVWYPDKVESAVLRMRCVEAFKPGPYLLGANASVVSEDRSILALSFLSDARLDPKRCQLNRVLVQSPVLGCTAIMNRALVDCALRHSPRISSIRWHDWWMALMAAAFGAVEVISEPVLEYRQHDTNQVGARSYGIRSILSKSGDAHRIAGDIYRQASHFLELYGDDLPEKSKRIVSDFVHAHHGGSLYNATRLVRGGYMKTGVIRGLGYLFAAARLKSRKNRRM